VTRNGQRSREILLRLRLVPLWRVERDFTGNAMGLGLVPSFLVALAISIASSMQRCGLRWRSRFE
jgi:hypothetical protein